MNVTGILEQLASSGDKSELPELARHDPDDPPLTALESDTAMAEPEAGAGTGIRKKRIQKEPETFKVGDFVVAVYDDDWYICQVEGDEIEQDGYTLLRYMTRVGTNQHFWDPKPDILRTLNSDILIKTAPPVPISSRYMGFPKKVFMQLNNLLRKFCVYFWTCFVFYLKHKNKLYLTFSITFKDKTAFTSS